MNCISNFNARAVLKEKNVMICTVLCSCYQASAVMDV